MGTGSNARIQNGNIPDWNVFPDLQYSTLPEMSIVVSLRYSRIFRTNGTKMPVGTLF